MSRSGLSRVDAVDLARGVALIGMMLVHLVPTWVDGEPTWASMVAGGRAAPLFALLAGVALSLVHRRDPHGVGSVRATCVRAGLLLVLGLWLGSLDQMPVYVILAFYGVLIVMALPFRSLPSRTLIGLGLAWAVVVPIVLLALQRWHGTFDASQAELADLQRPGVLLAELVLWGIYPAGVWMAYVLVGLGVGRLDLTDRRTSLRLAGGGLALLVGALAVGSVAIWRGLLDDGDGYVTGWRQLFVQSGYPYVAPSWRELWLVGEHTSRPLNVLAAIGSALLVVGLCGLVLRLPWGRLVTEPLRAAGAMTLTLYTAHVLWTWRIRVSEDGAISAGSLDRWLVQVVVLCAVAVLWRRLVGRGPLESVVRLVSLLGPRRTDLARGGAPDKDNAPA